jgi:hypothetical protein
VGLTVGRRLSILLLLSAIRLLLVLSVLLLRRLRSARQRRTSSRGGGRRRSASCAGLSGGEFTSETHLFPLSRFRVCVWKMRTKTSPLPRQGFLSERMTTRVLFSFRIS